ncbi:deaminase reductase [Longispora fulva]|uniref:Dihydrofolate reductase n=1 Tax=Longispora fulva TaxID=619741 RepID=A0A8J7GEJ0_9ACTN|nr:dihydrofolate reductase family protein [Longispora fulva]MBG6137259.1 dihydrofolate reductase [Longispora fulva]GIG61388.1 deaminase reductase [Longispora fulva]
MGKVLVHATLSLDGFMAGPGVSPEQPMGVGGMPLHEWMFRRPAHEVDAAVVGEVFADTGAVVLGRRTFDVGVEAWEDTPYPVPSFVLTHEARPDLPMRSAAFAFVTGGVDEALRRARAAAGDRDVTLMGGDVSRQFLLAGLVDEIHVQLVPVLLGAGVRLFDGLAGVRVELERTRILESPQVTHLRYAVLQAPKGLR